VIFRGREMVHNEIGRRILMRLADELTEVALVEVPPKQEGMTMVQILGPKKEAPPAKPRTVRKKAAAAGEAKEPKKAAGEPKKKEKKAPPSAGASDKTESGE